MDYTEFYNEKVYGEDITVKDKMNPSALELMQGVNNDGHYYGFPWAMALQSIVVNDTVVSQALGNGYKLPNTTAELEDFSIRIKNAGYTPFTYPGLIDYWTPCFFTWWAQYEGLENYKQFYNGKVYDEAQEQYVYSADIYKQQGRYEALYVMQELLDLDKGYHKGLGVT
jgi:maltose-binding protein MalE